MQKQTRNVRGVIGLGNPGERYWRTRHNAGFQVLDKIHRKYEGTRWKNNGNAWVAGVCIEGISVKLLKPATYMNLSGEAVAPFLRKYSMNPDDVIVVHDDLDILQKRVKVKHGGGHAGHKGLKSIINVLGTGNFCRVRVGIGKPEQDNTVDFVLSSPQNEEEECFQQTLETAVVAVETILVENMKTAMDLFNRKETD